MWCGRGGDGRRRRWSLEPRWQQLGRNACRRATPQTQAQPLACPCLLPSPAAHAAQIVRREGVLSLWRGWLPSWVRLGPHTCISLLVFERLRKVAGLEPI